MTQRNLRSVMRKLIPFGRVAGAGYVVLGLFALAFVGLRVRWPGVSIGEAILLAALVPAPVALALVWNRLSGFKVYGLEVSLAQASIQLETRLVDAVMVQYYSDNRELINLISNALIERRGEVVEIPLRRPEEPYWWSTRLFLVAALAQDFSRARTLVLVDGGEGERHFVGLVAPASLRLGIGRQFPILEEVYRQLKAGLDQAQPATQQVEQMIERWTLSAFPQDRTLVQEQDFKEKEQDFKELVDRFSLITWMAEVGGLDDRCVRWRGFQDRALLAEIVAFDGQYVPLVEHGHLHQVINRQAVVEEVAAKALR